MILAEKSLSPPGGWKYTQPESGKFFSGISYRQLFELVAAHRRGNNYDVAPGWEQRFEEEFCQQNQLVGTQWCPLQNQDPKPERSLGLSDVRRFLYSVQEAVVKKGDIFVSQEEAENRAATCASCINNATVPGCFGCNGLRNLVDKLRGNRHTSHDERLRHCTVCGCTNSVKVWLKESVIDSSGLEFPDHCWLKSCSPATAQEPAP